MLSYLPWQKQLGRCPVADELFLRLLAESAKGAAKAAAAGWSVAVALSGRQGGQGRPTAGVGGGDRRGGAGRGRRADTRRNAGRPGPGLRARSARQHAAARGSVRATRDQDGRGTGRRRAPLLILGDNAVLDTWKWLKLDRGRHRSPRPGVLWWPDSSLPPSLECQLRLMQLFTEWNISLGDISQEKHNENRENEP